MYTYKVACVTDVRPASTRDKGFYNIVQPINTEII